VAARRTLSAGRPLWRFCSPCRRGLAGARDPSRSVAHFEGRSADASAPYARARVTATVRIGDLEHSWEVATVVDRETTVDLRPPPEAVLTTLQAFAMSDLYVTIERTMSDGEVSEQPMRGLCVVWTFGFDEPPVFYTASQAIETWPGGVVGIVGPPGQGVSQPADAVRAWSEAYP
jgi:hypothetical protein